MPDPYEIATWRFEMIAPFVDDSLSPAEKARAFKDRTRGAISWPSGEERPIHRATLHRWIKAYRKGGLEALVPAKRRDRGRPRRDRSAWIERAVHLLLERPTRSLTLLLLLLASEFSDLSLSRSTLSREIRRHRLYSLVQKLRKKERRGRRRFQAPEPHHIWQLDGKGKFSVRFANGEVCEVTILTIIDDYSRAVLACAPSLTEHVGVAVQVFRSAAARWGLPYKVYCDLHSAYDSWCFRRGIAALGIHRILTRKGNAPARGKIEAYHRLLENWFVQELPHQEVIDLAHLQDLLWGFVETLYNPHRHRTLRQSPNRALDERRSPREVTMQELDQVFWIEKTLKAHHKTGEIQLPGGLFCVPKDFAGTRVNLRWDPVRLQEVFLLRTNQEPLPLTPVLGTEKKKPSQRQPLCAPGRLQRLVDHRRGRPLPQAAAGFGLPEIFPLLSSLLHRSVPETESEARRLLEFYQEKGPFSREAFELGLQKTVAALGTDRPLTTLLHYLTRLIEAAPDKENHDET